MIKSNKMNSFQEAVNLLFVARYGKLDRRIARSAKISVLSINGARIKQNLVNKRKVNKYLFTTTVNKNEVDILKTIFVPGG